METEYVKLDWWAEAKRIGLAKPFETWEIERRDGILDASMMKMQDGTKWAFLEWRLRDTFGPIQAMLRDVVLRSTELMKQGRIATRRDPNRALHDWLMLACAVLSSDAAVMREAAEQSVQAARGSKGDYEQALAGIVKSRILCDVVEEKRQLQVLLKSKPFGSHITPTNSLVRAFVERDDGAIARLVASGAKKHTDPLWAFDRRGIKEQTRDRMVLDIGHKHTNFFWPYPEAVFAKLAMIAGASTITHDDFWFPLGLVRAGVGAAATAAPLGAPGLRSGSAAEKRPRRR